MASHSAEEQQILDMLVYRVCRAFYEPKYIVVMDMINRLKQVKDEELASSLKLTVREIHKICGKLKEDRLIKDLTKQEARKPDQRPMPKTYYYLDYKIFVDVVKYKIHRMGKELDSTMSKQEVESAGYVCELCHRKYALVDVAHEFDPEYNLFKCPDDGSHLNEIAETEDDQGQEMKTKLRENTKPIVDLLKLTDSIVIEQFSESMIAKQAQNRTHDDDDLAFAEDGGQLQGEIQVVFEDDDDKKSKKKKENDAQQKRQQNAVPSWHAWSTVSGEMTALGAEAQKRHGLQADDSKAEGEGENLQNEGEDADYARRYYESLQEQQQQEQMRNDSQESLDSAGTLVGSLSKRPREDQEEYENGYESVEGSSQQYKKARNDSEYQGDSTLEGGDEDEDEEGFDEVGDLPPVSVNGQMIPLLEITEEHQASMTPDEYQAYYNICQQLQG